MTHHYFFPNYFLLRLSIWLMWPKYHSEDYYFLTKFAFPQCNFSCHSYFLLFSGQEVDNEENKKVDYLHSQTLWRFIYFDCYSSSPYTQDMAEQATCNLPMCVSGSTWSQIAPVKHHSINWIKVHTLVCLVCCCSPPPPPNFIHISCWLQPSLQQISSCSGEQRASHIPSASPRRGFAGCTFASMFQGRAGIKDNLISPWQARERRQAKRALTPLSRWLARISAFPEASHFGGIPTASSAPASESCGQSVRALAQLLQRWEITLARTERLHGQTAEQRNQYYSHALPWAILTYLRFLLSCFQKGAYHFPPDAAILRHHQEHHRRGHRHRSHSAGNRDLHLQCRLKHHFSSHSPPRSSVTRPDPALPCSAGRSCVWLSVLIARGRSWAPPALKAGGCGPGDPSSPQPLHG